MQTTFYIIVMSNKYKTVIYYLLKAVGAVIHASASSLLLSVKSLFYVCGQKKHKDMCDIKNIK